MNSAEKIKYCRIAPFPVSIGYIDMKEIEFGIERMVGGKVADLGK